MISFTDFVDQFTTREEHSLGMLQNSVQRRLPGHKRGDRGMEKIT
jgi:hypothetical protein